MSGAGILSFSVVVLEADLKNPNIIIYYIVQPWNMVASVHCSNIGLLVLSSGTSY